MTAAVRPLATSPITVTLAYYLSILILGLFSALGGPALPGLAANTGSALDQISLFITVGSLGYLLGSLFGGRAYDRLPGHRLMALTLLGIAASAALIPLSRSLALLLAVQFAFGLAKGANDAGCNTLLQWTYGPSSGPYLNGLHFSFGVGAAIAPLVLAACLALGFGFGAAYWAFALLCLPLAAWLWTLPQGSRAPARTGSAAKANPLPAILLLAASFALYVSAEVGFGSWIFTYALERGLDTSVTAAYLTSAFWGAFTLGRLLGIWISTRLRTTSILTLDLLGVLASLSLVALWPDSRTILWAGTIGTGLFMASTFPTLLVLGGERLQVSGALTGWLLVGGGLGGMILPWVIGQAFVTAGSSAMPLLVLAAIALSFSAILSFGALTGKTRVPSIE